MEDSLKFKGKNRKTVGVCEMVLSRSPVHMKIEVITLHFVYF